MAGVVTLLLGLSARPHAADQAMQQARLAYESGYKAQASSQLAQAAEYFPWRTELLILAGRSALQGDDPASAIHYLEQAAASRTLSPDELLTLGDAYLANGDTETALRLWNQVSSKTSLSADYYRRMAELHHSQADYAAWANDLKALVRLQSTDGPLYYQLGLLESVLEPPSAPSFLVQAAYLAPSLAAEATGLQRKVTTASLFDDPAYSILYIGQALASMDEWELAGLAFTKSTQARPDYAEAWAYLGEAMQHPVKAPQAGLAELQHAFHLNPDSISTNLFLGLYWQRQSDYPKALAYLSRAADLDPKNPIYQVEMGNTIAQTGDLPAAQAYFEQAIALAPDDPTYYRMLAEFALSRQIQVREVALPAARQAVILAPHDPQSLDLMGQTLILLEDGLNAERFLRAAIKANPALPQAHLHLGMLFLNQGKLPLARGELDLAKTLATDPAVSEQVNRILAYYFP